MHRSSRWFIVVCCAGLVACRHEPKAPTPPAAEQAPARAALTAADCGQCHAAIAAEWRGSLHARSTLEGDPLYRHLFAMAVKNDPRAEQGCRRCHYPDWWQVPGTVVEGVSCVVCHEVSDEHPQPLPDGRIAALARRHGARDDATGLCLSCHDTLVSPQGYAVCTTGPEAAEVGAGCPSCHMRRVSGAATTSGEAGGHAFHGFPGAHVPAFVAGAAALALSLDGGEVSILVTPARLGHALPTGNPMRYAVLTVEAYDAGGARLWRNVEGGGPPFEHPEALFMRVFSADGKRPVPPFLATAPSEDSRLPALGRREVRYPLPPGTRRVQARLDLHLGPPALLQAASVPGAWRVPRPIAEASLTVP